MAATPCSASKCERGRAQCQHLRRRRLVGYGYAQVMTVPPNVKYQDLFLNLPLCHIYLRPMRWAIRL